MRCRRVICAACCTRLDGINHCHACLKSLGSAREERPASQGLAAFLALSAYGVSSLLLFGLLFWLQGKLAP
jgi:hypothetical protein